MDEIIQNITQKGGNSIIYDGFLYRLDRKTKNAIDWRCTNSEMQRMIQKHTNSVYIFLYYTANGRSLYRYAGKYTGNYK